MGLTYFFLLTGDLSEEVALFSFLAAVGTTVGFAGIGYLTNDLADRKKDLLAGKENLLTEISTLQIALLFILFSALAIGPWFYLPIDVVSISLIVAEFLLFVLYAFPPFRLKEKGILGLFSDAMYAHVIPGILASWTFFLVGGKRYEYILPYLVVLSIWQLTSGIRNILSHQVKDYNNDLKSGIHTYITKRGLDGVENKMLKLIIPLEALFFLLFLLFIQIEVNYLFPVLFIYWLVILYKIPQTYRDSEQLLSKQKTNYLDDFYIKWLPVIILSGGVFIELEIRYIFLMHILLFMQFPYKILRSIKNKIG